MSLLLQYARGYSLEKFETGGSYEFFFTDKCRLCELAREKYWNTIVSGTAEDGGKISTTERDLTKKMVKEIDPITGDETCVEKYVDNVAKARADKYGITCVPTILFITTRRKVHVIKIEKTKYIVKDEQEYQQTQQQYDQEKQEEDAKACE